MPDKDESRNDYLQWKCDEIQKELGPNYEVKPVGTSPIDKKTELQQIREAMGPDWVIESTPLSWKPGDPVKNSAHVMLRQEYYASLSLPFGDNTVVTFEGELREQPYCAPELIDWDATGRLHNGESKS